MSCTESQLKAVRKWQANNKERVKYLRNRWRKDNSDKIALSRSKTIANTLFLAAKHRAIKYGIDFDLKKDDIIIPDYCKYLKEPITKVCGEGRVQSNPSIDRIDNTKGYTKDNIQIISNLANTMKSSSTKEQLIQFAKSILEMEGYQIVDRTYHSQDVL